jgi:hypothetical protein
VQVLRPFRYTLVTCGLFMLLGAILVGIRLAPLSLRSGVAWGTLWPLMAAAMATMFEMALIWGTPASLARAVEEVSTIDPTKSAGSSISSSQWRRCTWIAVLWFATSAALGAYANLRLGAPGRVARGVVEGARAVCEGGDTRRVEPIPLIGARWICSPTAASRIEGELSKNGAITRYSARDLDVSEDLAHLDLAELRISSSAARGRPALHLAVAGARVHGAWPWAKTRRMPGLWRAVYVAGIGSILGLHAMILGLRCGAGARWTAPAVGLCGSVTAWFVLGIVDSHANWRMGSYAMVPLVAVAAMIVVWGLRWHPWVVRGAARCVEWWHLRGLSRRIRRR